MRTATRPARIAFGVAAVALALVPLAAGIGRWSPLYADPVDGIWLQYRSLAVYPVDGLVVIILAAWVVARAAGWRGRNGRGPVAPALALSALALAAAWSTLTAFDAVLAAGTALEIAVLALFCAAAAEIAGSRPRGLLTALCVTVVAEATLAGWQALAQSTFPAGRLFNGWEREFAAPDVAASVAALPGVDRWLRSYGSFPHPNALGAFLAIALAVVVVGPGLSHRWRTATLVAGTVALTLTLSRSAWLAFILAAVTWLIATDAVRRILAARRVSVVTVGIALLIVGGGSVAALRLSRLDAPIERGSVDERSAENDAAWALVHSRDPVGAGNIVIAEQAVAPALGEPVHDAFLIALAEMGIPGLVAWALLSGALAGSAWVCRADPEARACPIVAFAVLVPLLLLDHFLWTQPNGRALVAWLVGLSVGMTSTSLSRP